MIVGIIVACCLASITCGAIRAILIAVFGIYLIVKVYVVLFAPAGLFERYKQYRGK